MAPKGFPKPAEDPANGGPSLAELWSFAQAPKPWKDAKYAAKNASRRNKTLKQVLAMERDRAVGRLPGEKRGRPSLAAAASARASREVSVATAMEVEVDAPLEGPSKPVITYMSIEAPPSLLPAKKYCDVTGLPASYTDPKSQLRYHNQEVYALIRSFAPSTHQAYLTLRGSGPVLL